MLFLKASTAQAQVTGGNGFEPKSANKDCRFDLEHTATSQQLTLWETQNYVKRKSTKNRKNIQQKINIEINIKINIQINIFTKKINIKNIDIINIF